MKQLTNNKKIKSILLILSIYFMSCSNDHNHNMMKKQNPSSDSDSNNFIIWDYATKDDIPSIKENENYKNLSRISNDNIKSNDNVNEVDTFLNQININKSKKTKTKTKPSHKYKAILKMTNKTKVFFTIRVQNGDLYKFYKPEKITYCDYYEKSSNVVYYNIGVFKYSLSDIVKMHKNPKLALWYAYNKTYDCIEIFPSSKNLEKSNIINTNEIILSNKDKKEEISIYEFKNKVYCDLFKRNLYYKDSQLHTRCNIIFNDKNNDVLTLEYFKNVLNNPNYVVSWSYDFSSNEICLKQKKCFNKSVLMRTSLGILLGGLIYMIGSNNYKQEEETNTLGVSPFYDTVLGILLFLKKIF